MITALIFVPGIQLEEKLHPVWRWCFQNLIENCEKLSIRTELLGIPTDWLSASFPKTDGLVLKSALHPQDEVRFHTAKIFKGNVKQLIAINMFTWHLQEHWLQEFVDLCYKYDCVLSATQNGTIGALGLNRQALPIAGHLDLPGPRSSFKVSEHCQREYLKFSRFPECWETTSLKHIHILEYLLRTKAIGTNAEILQEALLGMESWKLNSEESS